MGMYTHYDQCTYLLALRPGVSKKSDPYNTGTDVDPDMKFTIIIIIVTHTSRCPSFSASRLLIARRRKKSKQKKKATNSHRQQRSISFSRIN